MFASLWLNVCLGLYFCRSDPVSSFFLWNSSLVFFTFIVFVNGCPLLSVELPFYLPHNYMVSSTLISSGQSFFPPVTLTSSSLILTPPPITDRSSTELLLIILESMSTCSLLSLVTFLVSYLPSDFCLGYSHLESPIRALGSTQIPETLSY